MIKMSRNSLKGKSVFDLFSVEDLKGNMLVRAFARGDVETFRFHTKKTPAEVREFIDSNVPDTRYYLDPDGVLVMNFDSELLGIHLLQTIANALCSD